MPYRGVSAPEVSFEGGQKVGMWPGVAGVSCPVPSVQLEDHCTASPRRGTGVSTKGWELGQTEGTTHPIREGLLILALSVRCPGTLSPRQAGTLRGGAGRTLLGESPGEGVLVGCCGQRGSLSPALQVRVMGHRGSGVEGTVVSQGLHHPSAAAWGWQLPPPCFVLLPFAGAPALGPRLLPWPLAPGHREAKASGQYSRTESDQRSRH